MDSDIIINCSGLSSAELFEDQKCGVYLGHTVLIPHEIKLKKGNYPVSYNYEAGADLYASVNGLKQDVYAYPRRGQLVLGGSRIPGSYEQGNFYGQELPFEMVKTAGKEVPAPLLELNSQIIQEFFGVNLDDYSDKIGRIAYRYTRDKVEGLRIEAEEMHEKLVLHNYGNGGAGVTISWGAAIKVYNLYSQRMGREGIEPEDLIRKLGHEPTQ
jgi:hypothetical protein